MMYCQITFAERYTLGLLRQRGLRPAAIARVLGRHRSSIGREIRRNRSNSDGTYRLQLADWYARSRRSRSRRNAQFTAADWARVEALVREGWSPEQIAGRLRRGAVLSISHETIYRRIWRDKRSGGSLYIHLRGARKQKRKRYGAYDSRGRLAGKRPITARPAGAEHRSRFGHWEADTMLGAGQAGPCVLTLVERKSGFLVIGKLKHRAAPFVNRRALRLVNGQPRPGANDHRRQRDRVSQLRGARGADPRPVLLRDSASLVGRRNQREHERPAPPVPPKRQEHGRANSARLQSHRREAEPPANKRLGYRTPEECYVP
jgi:IS30 family transposase